MKKIAIFASGTGTNAARIIDHFSGSDKGAKVALLVSNKQGAGVLSVAAQKNIPALVIGKEQFYHGDAYVPYLKERSIDWIVLAGFLWKVPARLIQAFPERIINIHPALLPQYGGKGMYGRYVHEAVLQNQEKQSGITIHCVDEIYDHGRILFQAACTVQPGDTPALLENRVRQLELEHYPRVIEELVRKAEA